MITEKFIRVVVEEFKENEISVKGYYENKNFVNGSNTKSFVDYKKISQEAIDFKILTDAYKKLYDNRQIVIKLNVYENPKRNEIEDILIGNISIVSNIMKEYTLMTLFKKTGIGCDTEVFNNVRGQKIPPQIQTNSKIPQVAYFNKYVYPGTINQNEKDYQVFGKNILNLISNLGLENIHFNYDSYYIYLQLVYETKLDENNKDLSTNQRIGNIFELIHTTSLKSNKDVIKLPNLFYLIDKSNFNLVFFRELDAIYKYVNDSKIILGNYTYANEINKFKCDEIEKFVNSDDKNNDDIGNFSIEKDTILYVEVKKSLNNNDLIQNNNNSNVSLSFHSKSNNSYNSYNSYFETLDKLQKFYRNICFFDPYFNSKSLYLLNYNEELKTYSIKKNLDELEHDKCFKRLNKIIINFEKIKLEKWVKSHIDNLSIGTSANNNIIKNYQEQHAKEIAEKDRIIAKLIQEMAEKDKLLGAIAGIDNNPPQKIAVIDYI